MTIINYKNGTICFKVGEVLGMASQKHTGILIKIYGLFFELIWITQVPKEKYAPR